MNRELKKFVVSAVFIAMAFVLSFIKIFRMPLGGSVTLFSMFVISLPAYLYGAKYGFVSAFIYSLLQLLQGGSIMHPAQIFLDYIFAFTCFGIVAFFRDVKHGSYIGFLIACIIRWLSSSLSGYIFFKEYAPETWNPIIYTLAYNGGYIFAEYLITIIFVSIPQIKNLLHQYKE